MVAGYWEYPTVGLADLVTYSVTMGTTAGGPIYYPYERTGPDGSDLATGNATYTIEGSIQYTPTVRWINPEILLDAVDHLARDIPLFGAYGIANRANPPPELSMENIQEAYRWVANSQVFDSELQRSQQVAANRLSERQEVVQVARLARGEALLKDILGEKDYRHFSDLGYLDIQSPKDIHKRYRIRANRRIGIVKQENGHWVEKPLSLCVHPEDSYRWVQGDLVATHVLLAKFNEGMLERVANLHQMAA